MKCKGTHLPSPTGLSRQPISPPPSTYTFTAPLFHVTTACIKIKDLFQSSKHEAQLPTANHLMQHAGTRHRSQSSLRQSTISNISVHVTYLQRVHHLSQHTFFHVFIPVRGLWMREACTEAAVKEGPGCCKLGWTAMHEACDTVRRVCGRNGEGVGDGPERDVCP